LRANVRAVGSPSIPVQDDAKEKEDSPPMFGFNSHVDVYLNLSNLGSTYEDLGSVAVLIAYPYTVWTQSYGFVAANPGGALQVESS
jgi:hypothetical protein